MSPTFSTTADPFPLLRALAPLGPVRILMRNCSGFAELFCDTTDIVLTRQWLHVGIDGARLHLPVRALRGARLEPSTSPSADALRPALWLYGRCGSPFLGLIFDQTRGETRRLQEAQFEVLRARYGDEVGFAADAEPPPIRQLH
jgi:hypothetical protein